MNRPRDYVLPGTGGAGKGSGLALQQAQAEEGEDDGFFVVDPGGVGFSQFDVEGGELGGEPLHEEAVVAAAAGDEQFVAAGT